MPALKIKISTLFMIIYCFVMFVPGYFSNAGIKLLSNLMMVVAAFFLLRHKYKPNKFIGQRAYPLLEMFELSLKDDTPVVWGV